MKTETPSPVGRKDSRSTAAKRSKARPRWNNLVKSADEQYELKRQAVIAEAIRAFGHKGYQNTSLDDIASRLNVTKPALYYYFKSKKELLYECHNLAMDIGDRAIEYVESQPGSGLEKLQRLVEYYIDNLTRELSAPAILHEIDAMRPEHRRRILQRRRKFDRLMRGLVEEGIADGTIEPCNPKLAVFWFMSAINGIPRWFRSDGELTGAEIAKAFVQFLVGGLQKRK
ncbi:MAG TPA: TetR/AcrR family transcriptional regulator [Zeimonas sp.]|nr:TetR/AcrR family transcriptional regulator [Zeimonas sp.]